MKVYPLILVIVTLVVCSVMSAPVGLPAPSSSNSPMPGLQNSGGLPSTIANALMPGGQQPNAAKSKNDDDSDEEEPEDSDEDEDDKKKKKNKKKAKGKGKGKKGKKDKKDDDDTPQKQFGRTFSGLGGSKDKE